MINTLTTGDVVVHQDGKIAMITVGDPNISGILTIENLLSDLDRWELEKSRLYVSAAELRRIEEYHEAIKKQQQQQKG